MPLLLAFALADASNRILLRNSLLLVGATLLIALPVGCGLAVLLFRTDLPGRRFFRVVLGMSLLAPLYLITGAWLAGFGLQGWFTQLFDLPAPLVWWRGAIAVHAAVGIPWVVWLVGLALRQVDTTAEEAALLETSPAAVLWHVTLPQVAPAILLAALWVGTLTAGEMTVTDLFRIRTYAEEIYTAVAGNSDATTEALQVLPGVLLTGAWVVAGLLVAARVNFFRYERVDRRRPIQFTLGRGKPAMLVLTSLVVILLAGVPLGNLVYQAGLDARIVDGAPQRIWSIGKAIGMVTSSYSLFGNEYRSTLQVVSLAASISLLLAIPLAWLSTLRRAAGVAVACGLAALIAVPGPLLGMALVSLFRHFPNVYDSMLPPVVALVARSLPPATLVLWLGFRSLSAAVLDSAALDGAGPWKRLLLIGLPGRKRFVVLAWLLAAIVSLGDLSASVLVAPPGGDTLAIRILDRLHSNADDQVAGVCLLLILLLGIAAAGIGWLCSLHTSARAEQGQVRR